MKFDFITIGGATEDISFYVSDSQVIKNKKDILRQKLLAFEYGAKINIDKIYTTFGGGAANTAINFSNLGFKVACVVSLGGDERGERIINNLKSNKINISLIQRNKKEKTGFNFLIIGPENEHVVFVNESAKALLKITNLKLKKIKNTKWIYISSLAGKWLDNLRKIYSLSKVNFSWNPGAIQLKSGARVLKPFIAKTKVFCLNKDEAIELVISDPKYKKKTRKFLNNSRNLQRIIKSWGAEIVVITKGKYGVDVYDGECFYHQNIIKEKKKVDTTGMGDAFNSSFVAGLEIYDGDIKKAMRLGLRTTASLITKQGAQNGLLTKKDI